MTSKGRVGIRRKGTVVKSREARDGLQVGEAKRVCGYLVKQVVRQVSRTTEGWRQPSDSVPVEALSRCPLPDCALKRSLW